MVGSMLAWLWLDGARRPFFCYVALCRCL